jgi:hypothetical protein
MHCHRNSVALALAIEPSKSAVAVSIRVFVDDSFSVAPLQRQRRQ